MRRAHKTIPAMLVGLVAAWAQDAAAQTSNGPVTERRDSLQSAAQAPAEDLNLKQTPIPEALARAELNPYETRGFEGCATIALEVQRLDEALGADADEPPTADPRSLGEKRENTAAGVLRFGVEAMTPYRGVIRMVSGAEAYEKRLQKAVEAGYARRGFLKGRAMGLNCPPPAAPAWFRPAEARTRPTETAYAPPQESVPEQPAPAFPRPAFSQRPRYQAAPGYAPYPTYGPYAGYSPYDVETPYPYAPWR